jgi:hypothetical protein
VPGSEENHERTGTLPQTAKTESPGADRKLQPRIEKPVENQSVFMKIRETGLDLFHQFLVNRPMNLKIFKIKNSKN